MPEVEVSEARLGEHHEEARVEPLLVTGARGLRGARARHARLRGQERLHRRVVIGLSGGIDSSLVAAIAVDALGSEHVVGVLMPSRFSSEGSVADAEALAANLGIETMTVPDRGRARRLPRHARPDVRRPRTRVGGGEPPGADPRHGPDGDVEQVRLARAHHRQQERDGHRLLDALRRHGGRLRRHQGRAEDARVRARPRSQRPRRPPGHARRRCSRSRPARSCGPTSRTPTPCPRTRCSTRSSRATWRTTCRSAELEAAGFDAETVRRVAQLVDRNEYKRRQAPPGVRVSPKAFGKDRRLPITNRWPG